VSAPLVVNTRDGVCWTRRTVTSGGIALYAPEQVRTCPGFVMATIDELAEQGIVGSAFALPVPVAPEPQPRTMLDRARDALNARMAKDDLRLVLENVIGYAAWLESERHSTNEALPDAAEALRANRGRIAELEQCQKNQADNFEVQAALIRQAEARVAELESQLAERDQSADTYPPALPWARLMDHEDLSDFLDELAASAITHGTSEVALTEVESTIARWRVIGEAQHAHNTAPGPNAEEDCDHPNGYGPNGCAGCGAFRPADDEPGMRHAVRTETGGAS
jgi:TolA-binding protein